MEKRAAGERSHGWKFAAEGALEGGRYNVPACMETTACVTGVGHVEVSAAQTRLGGGAEYGDSETG